jgi:hypothetical protein
MGDGAMKASDVKKMIEDCGGKIETVGSLPDGSGFATASFPLRSDHWIYGDKKLEDKYGFEAPPMPLRIGNGELLSPATLFYVNKHPELVDREALADMLRDAGRYAVRASTMKGKEMDFDPDAMLQNLVVGMLGYWTETGLSQDDFGNPKGCPVPPAAPDSTKSTESTAARKEKA